MSERNEPGCRTYAGKDVAEPWWHRNVADLPVDYEVVYVDVAPSGYAYVTLKKKDTRAIRALTVAPTLVERDPDCSVCGKVDATHPYRSGTDGLVWRGGQGGDWEVCECRKRPAEPALDAKDTRPDRPALNSLVQAGAATMGAALLQRQVRNAHADGCTCGDCW